MGGLNLIFSIARMYGQGGGEKMAIAKIIVDVPLMQTDQPYSYRIPEEFEGMLEVGMRVHVPFGKGNR